MDSPVALALMTKAKAIFEKPDTFLSFPLSLAYSKDELNRVTSTDISQDQIRSLSEFSRLVNLVPGGTDWPPTEEHYLWDIYEDIFDTAKLATSARTPEEQKDYEKALNFLHKLTPDGVWEDSAQVKAYNQYKDAWYMAQQEYNAKKVEATVSTDAAVKQQWQQLEPMLRQKIIDAEQLWASSGFRAQVEDARRIEALLRDKSPGDTWYRWRNQFQPDIDLRTDTNEFRFAISSFAPSNVLNVNAWQKFTLSSSEVQGLIRLAPPELRTRLVPDEAATLEIESVSFEYTSVGITRPWFIPDVFAARFWKFYEGSKTISDGGNPAHGRCPAYAAGLVLVRNLAVQTKARSAANDKVCQTLKTKPLMLAGFPLQKIAANTPRASTLFGGQAAPTKFTPVSAKSARPYAVSTPVLRARTGITHTASAVAVAPPPPKTADPLTLRRGLVRLQGAGFTRSIARPKGPVPPGQPAGSGTPAAPPGEQPIYIMAFICKRISKCPDPDPSLQW